MALPDFLNNYWILLPEWMRLVVWTGIKIGMILLPVIICVAYLTYFERKAIGYFHSRKGPNRVGPWGLGQPWADVFKMLTKEIVIPAKSNNYLFIIAPVLAFAPAVAAWAVIPFSPTMTLANINAGLLYLLAMTSLGVYGVLIAGWASNSKYALLGAMRSAAQIVGWCSYGFEQPEHRRHYSGAIRWYISMVYVAIVWFVCGLLYFRCG